MLRNRNSSIINYKEVNRQYVGEFFFFFTTRLEQSLQKGTFYWRFSISSTFIYLHDNDEWICEIMGTRISQRRFLSFSSGFFFVSRNNMSNNTSSLSSMGTARGDIEGDDRPFAKAAFRKSSALALPCPALPCLASRSFDLARFTSRNVGKRNPGERADLRQ